MTTAIAPSPISLALVPIRGGSKGLPGKNTRVFAGRPLYEHAVLQGLAFADRCLISTDIKQVIDAGGALGSEVLRRPAELAGDGATMDVVIADVVVRAGMETGTMLLLQATSPLRRAADIAAAITLYETGQHDLVMSVTRTDSEPLKYGFVEDGTFCAVSESRYCFSNRQSLPPLYRPNGAVYVFGIEWFRRNGSLATDRIGAVVMEGEMSLDIDTLQDFERAEALFFSALARDKDVAQG